LAAAPAKVRDAEAEAVRRFVAEQFAWLTRRHPPATVILLRVLADEYQHAAVLVKDGDVQGGHTHAEALDRMSTDESEELRAIRALSAQPVWALIWWKEGDPARAIEALMTALEAAERLADRYGYSYLSSKRIHLAANLARVFESTDALERATNWIHALRAVVAGDSSAWPLEGSSSLAVPLQPNDRLAIETQLDRIEERIAAKRHATASRIASS